MKDLEIIQEKASFFLMKNQEEEERIAMMNIFLVMQPIERVDLSLKTHYRRQIHRKMFLLLGTKASIIQVDVLHRRSKKIK